MNPVLDHLWQSTLCAAVAAVLTLALKRNHARARYWVWLAASVKFLIPFAVLATLGSRMAPLAPAPDGGSRFMVAVEEMGTPFQAASIPGEPTLPAFAPSFFIMIWAVGCAGTLIFWRMRWLGIKAALENARPLFNGPEHEALQRVNAGISKKPVRLVSSTSSLEPGVFGIFRPVIMLPSGIADHLTDAQLEAILAHEVCHVRRRDNLAAALHMAVEALFWFHPLVWWMGSRLVKEREEACDEEVLRLGSEPRVYAEGILRVCRFYLESPLHCAAGISGTNLKQRVHTIMSARGPSGLNLGTKLLLACSGFAALAGPVVFGMINQRPAAVELRSGLARPSFNEASIKASPRQPVGDVRVRHTFKISPQGLTVQGISFSDLIQFAYGITVHELSGPEWLKSERYDIVATTAKPAPLATLKLMTQTMLEERLKLVVHREKRDAQIYALVLSNNGRKLSAARNTAAKEFRISHGGFEFHNISIPEFAARLSDLGTIDRPVVDRTGITGSFDIALDGGLNSIEQLGLKLQAKKGLLDILVVDHAEKLL